MFLPLRTTDATDAFLRRSLPAPQLPRTPGADAQALRRIARRACANDALSQAPANDAACQRRIARMLRDCEVSAAPAVQLAAACAAIAAFVAFGTLMR